MHDSPLGNQEDLLVALFAKATEGMLIVSKDGVLLESNAASCQQTGYDKETLCQLSLTDLFPEKLPAPNVQFQNCQMRQQDGRIITVSVETRTLKHGRFLLILRHPTEQTAAREKITRLTETIQAVNHLATNLNSLLTATDPLKQIAAIIREMPGVFGVTVSTYRPKTRELVLEQLAMPTNESSLLTHINSLLGRSLLGMHIPLDENIRQRMFHEMVTTVGTLHEITFGEIPKPVSALFHRTFRLDKLYGLALVEGEDLLGTIVIVMRRDAEPLTRELRIMLSRICAITLRRSRYEQQLQASEAKFRSYIEHAPHGIFVVDGNGRYLETNPAATKMLGYTPEEIKKLTISNIIHPDYLEAGLEHFQTVMDKGQAGGEYRLLTKDGQMIWATVEAVKLNDDRLIAFKQDITAQKLTEKSSKIKDELLQLTGEMGHIGGWEFDTQTLAGTWTDEVARIHDLEPSEETDANFGLSFYEGEAREKIEQAIEEIMANGTPYDLDLPFTTAKGKQKWVRTMAIPIWEDGKVVKVRGIFQDVTNVKMAEETLRKQIDLQHQLTQIAATVPGMICSYKLSPDGHITMPFTSAALDDLFGLSAEELAADASIVFELMHPDDRERVTETIGQSAETLQPWREEYRLNHPWKGERWFESYSMPHREKDGAIFWHGFIQDITERKWAEEAQAKLEEHLRQSQKMESIGQLAGGVAHDFNNLLTVIQMYSDLMHHQMAADDPMLPKLEQIQQASRRATDLTGQLLAFSRKQILTPTRVNLNELVENLQKMLTRLIGEDIDLSTTLHDDLWPIKADAGQMEQVIMNLVINARDAMPTGGKLTIETNNVVLDDSLISTQLGTPVGPCVLLAITDTGVGMDAATQQRVFEPFFTTKEIGRGTGLGLATVHGIVRQSEGSIFIYSEPDQGTTFKIYLPATTNQIEENAPEPIAQPKAQYGNETILLVEDEDAVRQLVKVTLQGLGYKVLIGKDGAHGLRVAQSFKGEIDLLLTDVVMPHMSGRELAETLKSERPELKILFMSGYMDDAVIRHGILKAEVSFLPKPFTRKELSQIIREVLHP